MEDQTVVAIGSGLVVLLGIAKFDCALDASYLVERTVNLRIFPGNTSNFNRSALDVGAELLVISQFTLYSNTRKGRRPDFTQAAQPQEAKRLYLQAIEKFRESGLTLATGSFGEYMKVELNNDGPVTLILDSADRLCARRS
jgi:D-tyrosyl-tRNA(Tyr) deacylase